MAQAARQTQALTLAPRHAKPRVFGGTDAAWRVLCDLYPTAETPEIIMALVEYCAAKRLDPFKRPVHIVPMYNAKLRRRVQVVMRGINEIETVAARTGLWAGLDLPQWGEEIERTFRGTVENDDGSTRAVEVTLRFPLWCAVTAYRLVGGERRAFSEQLFWEESYATSGFRSEVPNERWQKARRQMLHKCTKAAVLRTTFPEEGLGYAAEEMEDRTIEAGGVTIEGTLDQGEDPGLTERDRRIDQPPSPNPPGQPVTGLDLLQEDRGTIWLRNLHTLLRSASTEAEVVEIAGHPRVRASLDTAPTLTVADINAMIREAHERVRRSAPVGEATNWEEPLLALLAEVEAMDLPALDDLRVSPTWKQRTRDLFPPDFDQLEEAIAARRATLQGDKRHGQ